MFRHDILKGLRGTEMSVDKKVYSEETRKSQQDGKHHTQSDAQRVARKLVDNGG